MKDSSHYQFEEVKAVDKWGQCSMTMDSEFSWEVRGK